MGVAPRFALADWVRAFQGLMPRGRVWPREGDATQTKAITALLGNHKRQADAAAAEIEDSFPTSAITALPDWEAALGLPDPCAGPDATIALRQSHVGARLAYRGGQSVVYFTGYAASLGYSIEITQYKPSRFGNRVFGTPFGGDDWAFAWRVNAPGFTIFPFLFGDNHFGDAFATWTSSVLLCELQRIKPAHTVVVFEVGTTVTPPAPGAQVVGPQLAISDAVIT